MEQDHSVKDREPVVGLDTAHRPQGHILMEHQWSMVLVAEVFRAEVDEASRLAADEGEVDVLGAGDSLLLRQRIIPLLHQFR
jgi:hypothetical protein